MDAALDELVARLNTLTGLRWHRYPPWNVAVTVLIGEESWIYVHPVRLRHLDADIESYAQEIVIAFQEKKLIQSTA